MPPEATMLDSPAFAIASFFAFVLCITKVLSDNWTKRKLIEARVSDDVIRTLFRKESDPEMFAALKWGLVLVALGLGLIVSQYLPSGFEEPLAWGVVLVFGGAGLLAYYAVARALVRRAAGAAPQRHRTSFDEHV
jgi:hypothetical protein